MYLLSTIYMNNIKYCTKTKKLSLSYMVKRYEKNMFLKVHGRYLCGENCSVAL